MHLCCAFYFCPQRRLILVHHNIVKVRSCKNSLDIERSLIPMWIWVLGMLLCKVCCFVPLYRLNSYSCHASLHWVNIDKVNWKSIVLVNCILYDTFPTPLSYIGVFALTKYIIDYIIRFVIWGCDSHEHPRNIYFHSTYFIARWKNATFINWFII